MTDQERILLRVVFELFSINSNNGLVTFAENNEYDLI